MQAALGQWLIKVMWDALLTPVIYAMVGWLKRREGVEVFDAGTNFSLVGKVRLGPRRAGGASRSSQSARKPIAK